MAGVILCEDGTVGVELLVRSGNGELAPNRTTLPVSLVMGNDLIQYVYEPGMAGKVNGCMRKTGARMEVLWKKKSGGKKR